MTTEKKKPQLSRFGRSASPPPCPSFACTDGPLLRSRANTQDIDARAESMIVREGAGGSLIIIGQTDHAKLSGQCAAHWGNKDFARPKPYEAVVRAAMFHDSGWY